MRYSEVKALLRQIHAARWWKIPGQRYYRKNWFQGPLHVGQSVLVEEFLESSVPLSDVLAYYERLAQRAFQEQKERNVG